MPNQPWLVVGQGLAGSSVALTLLEKGEKVVVIDPDPEHSSSKVAAGMWNPLVFRKLTFSWELQKIIEPFKAFHQHWQQELSATWFHEKPIARIFADHAQNNDWYAKMEQEEYHSFLAGEDQNNFDFSNVKHPFGYGLTKQSGYVDLNVFLKAVKEFLKNQNAYLKAHFDFKDFKLIDGVATYQNTPYKGVIFCEGYQMLKQNEYFNWLPLNGTKGQVLILKNKDKWPDAVINKKEFVLPIGTYEAKLGATFEWKYEDPTEPTEEGKKELWESLKGFMDTSNITVQNHMAGVRPTVKDRRPLVGQHPVHKNLSILNGLGTKGVMLAPTMATLLVAQLLEDMPVWREVDIKRYWK